MKTIHFRQWIDKLIFEFSPSAILRMGVGFTAAAIASSPHGNFMEWLVIAHNIEPSTLVLVLGGSALFLPKRFNFMFPLMLIYLNMYILRFSVDVTGSLAQRGIDWFVLVRAILTIVLIIITTLWEPLVGTLREQLVETRRQIMMKDEEIKTLKAKLDEHS